MDRNQYNADFKLYMKSWGPTDELHHFIKISETGLITAPGSAALLRHKHSYKQHDVTIRLLPHFRFLAHLQISLANIEHKFKTLVGHLSLVCSTVRYVWKVFPFQNRGAHW